MYSSSIITKTDLQRMINKINPTESEIDFRKSIDDQLKMKSKARIKTWSDCLENANKRELEAQKMKFLKEEEMKRKIDEEEFKFQEYNKALKREQVKKQMFESQELVRNFMNKMEFCDTLKEREIQIAQKKLMEERNKKIDKMYDDMDKQKEKEEIEKNLLAKEREQNKKKEQFDILSQQVQEAKLKKMMEIQENYVEGQINKIQAIKGLKAEQDKKDENRRRMQSLNEELIRHNEELKMSKLREQKKHEEEEDQKILEYEKKKNELDSLRAKKEKEKFEETQNRREMMFQKNYENLQNLKREEEKKLEKYMNAKTSLTEPIDYKKIEKRKKLQLEIDEDRRLFFKRKAEEKINEKEKDKELLNIWLNNLKAQEDKQKQAYLEKRQKEKEIYNFRSKQIQDKKARAITEFNNLQEEGMKNTCLLQKEKDDFLKFAEEQIVNYKNQGKDILPLLLELKYDRKKGLV